MCPSMFVNKYRVVCCNFNLLQYWAVYFTAFILNFGKGVFLASFPGPARLSLAVRNSLRGPGLVHYVMSATVAFLRHQITMFAVLPIYMYNGVSSETSQARTIDYSRKL